MRKIYLLGLALILAGSSALSQYCVSGGPSSPDDSNVESVTLMGDVTNISYTGCSGGGGVTSVQD